MRSLATLDGGLVDATSRQPVISLPD
jgi:hypothetical protein